MKYKAGLIIFSLLFSLLILEGCKSSKTGKTRGRQQPKNGKMPCPMKDC
jgi:hypothetical protein